MSKRSDYHQPKLPDVNWGEIFDLERAISAQGDVLLRFKSAESDYEGVLPIKYSLEGSICTSLGIVAVLAGLIDQTPFREGVEEIEGGQEDKLSYDDTYSRMIRVALDEEHRTQRYRERFWTYQGYVAVCYEPPYRQFELEHVLDNQTSELVLDFSMIPTIANVTAEAHESLSEEYLEMPRKISSLISELWRG